MAGYYDGDARLAGCDFTLLESSFEWLRLHHVSLDGCIRRGYWVCQGVETRSDQTAGLSGSL